MLENQLAFEAEPVGEFRRRRPRLDLGFRNQFYEQEFDFEGGPAACGTYERGEIQRSNTETGHLPADFFTAPNGFETIADFAVGSPAIKSSVRNDPNLKAWINRMLQITALDPSAQIKIVGYTDCVNKENRNARLRKDRANGVLRLIDNLVGRDPRWGTAKTRFSIAAAPLDQFIVDNSTPVNRATNRGVSLQLTRSMSFDAEDVCDNRIRTVTVWINAFIPRDIQGRTRAVPPTLVQADPSMSGKTMFYTNFGCGLTDQRDFSDSPTASARMHSRAKIDLVTPRILDQRHRIDPSVQLDCLTGAVVCNARSPVPAGTKFTWVGISADKEVMVKVDGSQGPACPTNRVVKKAGQFLLDAKIDYHGTFFIKRTVLNGKRLSNYVDIGFLGKVDLFPAYEFVVQLNNSNPVHLGGIRPKPNSSPVTHLGTSAKVHFVTRLSLACRTGKQTARIENRIIN